MATDYVVEHLDRVASTQDEARARYSGRPIAVSAVRQDAGRGRSGAEWLNADRALAVSVAFSLPWPPTEASVVPLIAGLAARDTLGPDDVRLKWPNDLVTHEGAKLGGLLAELHDDVVVIGCGANLYWKAPPEGMTGLFADDPGVGGARKLAETFTARLLARVATGPEDWGRNEYRAACSTLGQAVEWDGGSGRAEDVDVRGGLVVSTGPQGRVTLRSGAVRQVRATTLPLHDGGATPA